jgi:hypothetical protein
VAWVISLLLVFDWVKGRYPSTLLQIEPDRVTVERVLSNLKWVDEARLGVNSCAKVVESFSERYSAQEGSLVQTIFHVEVRGTDNYVCIGACLADLEKVWIADRINEFIELAAKK